MPNCSGLPPSQGFAPELTWSHYRALSRVTDPGARTFYEREAIESGWNKDQLERQIQSFLYQRILSNQGEAGLVASDRERLAGERVAPEEILRSPVVLEFLSLPDDELIERAEELMALLSERRSALISAAVTGKIDVRNWKPPSSDVEAEVA